MSLNFKRVSLNKIGKNYPFISEYNRNRGHGQ